MTRFRKALRRVVSGRISPEAAALGREPKQFVVELQDRGFTIRPKGAHSGKVFVSWESAYERQLVAEAPAPTRRRRHVSRSLLR